jgi:hypothetical protein
MEAEEQQSPPDESLIGDDEAVDQDSPPDESLIREEEQAAAEQAGRIGGEGGAEDVEDEAERPVVEAGGGVSEGGEEMEKDLTEQSTHAGEE